MKKILALTLALLLMLPLASCGKKKNKTDGSTTPVVEPELPGVDMLNADLSEYIEIDEKYYRNYTVEVTLNTVTELEIDNAIIQVLCDSKDTTALEDGDGIISVGDVVNIFYKGYYLNGEEKVYFSGGSNIGSASHALEIGSGGFIPGFEYNMIGKNPADYDADNPMVVETFFPKNYGSSELAGKTAYFEVYVEMKDGEYVMTEYSAPELTEEFIKDTLKFTDSILEKYEGDTVLEKYRSYVRYILEWNGINLADIIWEAFLTEAVAGAVVKKYPEKQLKEAYDDVVAQAYDAYEYYSIYFNSFDKFVCWYFGVSEGGNWSLAAEEQAKLFVKRDLLFYHIMNLVGLKPTAEEYEELYEECVVSLLEGQKITPERYSTEEEYLSARKQFIASVETTYGVDYLKKLIYNAVGKEGIIDLANVVEIRE